jgi:hypothetical protein
MKRLFLLGFAFALSLPALAPASPCTDGCSTRLRRQLSICTSNYAGDSELIYQCSQEAQAQYDDCVSGCGG